MTDKLRGDAEGADWMAENWKHRADDVGRLSRAYLALRATPPSSEPEANPKLLESAAAMMEYGRCIATDDDAASKFAYFRDQLRLAASPQPTSKEPK